MLHVRKLSVFVLVILGMVVVVVPVVLAQVTPAVTVADQSIVNNAVLEKTAVSNGSGWIVLMLAVGLIALVGGAMLVMGHRISQTKLI